ncbi:hypothetical protein ACHAWC_001654 [Mediolabrus comicus]
MVKSNGSYRSNRRLLTLEIMTVEHHCISQQVKGNWDYVNC